MRAAGNPVGQALLVALVAALAGCGSTDEPPPSTPSASSPVARPTHTGMTAALTLSSDRVRTGSSITGRITVTNDSGHPLRFVGCGSIFAVVLVRPGHQPEVAWPLCAQDLTIPEGTTSYPVTVRATESECSTTPGQGMASCGSDGALPPLAPGRYAATTVAVSPDVPVPGPAAVTVTG